MNQATEDRFERIAIALTALEKIPAAMMDGIRSHLDFTRIVRVPAKQIRVKGDDVPAVEFKCSLLQAALICDVIRNIDRQIGADPAELYLHRGTVWSRIPWDRMLTILVQGRAVLNPRLFADVELPQVDEAPREAVPIRRM